MHPKLRKKCHYLDLKGREIRVWGSWYISREQQSEKVKEISQDIPKDYTATYKKESPHPIPWKLKYCEVESEHAKQQNKKLPDKVKETCQDIPKDYNANYKKESKNMIDFSKIDFSKGIRSRNPYQYEK